MANVYESKFKGVEIDDGVNTATYATGTGGINVTIKGTTNVTGTGGRHLEIDGSGKQDKITDQTSLNVGTLTLNSTTGISYDPSYTAGTLILNKNQEAITLKASEARIVFRSRKKNVDRSIIQTVTFDNGTFYTHDILDPATAKNIKQLLPSSDGTFIVSSGTLAPGKLISAGPNPYTVVDSGIKTADIMTTGNVKTINGESIIGSGDITIGGGSAGVSSIGGKTGAITLSTGLAMSGQQLTPKVKNIYKDSSNYLCIDTN